MTYGRTIVICTFRALNPDDLAVTEDKLDEFDESLEIEFDAEARKQAGDNGIANTQFNLSMLVCLAALSTATIVVTQVKQACKFFLAAKP
jgi:hypothetical protein